MASLPKGSAILTIIEGMSTFYFVPNSKKNNTFDTIKLILSKTKKLIRIFSVNVFLIGTATIINVN